VSLFANIYTVLHARCVSLLTPKYEFYFRSVVGVSFTHRIILDQLLQMVDWCVHSVGSYKIIKMGMYWKGYENVWKLVMAGHIK
jgi:hypothetical protein